MEFRNAVASVRTTLANVLDPSRARRAHRTEADYLRATLDGRMISAAGQQPGTWARIISTAGAPAGFVYRCHCGTSYPFPEQTIFEHLQEKDRPQCSNRTCHARNGAFDFAGAIRLRVASTSGDDAAFKAFLDKFEGTISAADFIKTPDGQYWLRDEKRPLLLARLPQIPDASFTSDDNGPLIIPTDGPDFTAEYAPSDPEGKGSAGFGVQHRSIDPDEAAADPEHYHLPKSWLEKRAKAYERHRRAHGPEAELRNLEIALAPIEDPALRAQIRNAILRDDPDEVTRLASEIACEKETIGLMVGEGAGQRMVRYQQNRNVSFILDAQANFCGCVTEVEARALLAKVEKRDAGD